MSSNAKKKERKKNLMIGNVSHMIIIHVHIPSAQLRASLYSELALYAFVNLHTVEC